MRMQDCHMYCITQCNTYASFSRLGAELFLEAAAEIKIWTASQGYATLMSECIFNTHYKHKLVYFIEQRLHC